MAGEPRTPTDDLFRIFDLLVACGIGPSGTVQAVNRQRVPEMVERLIERDKVAHQQWEAFAAKSSALQADREAFARRAIEAYRDWSPIPGEIVPVEQRISRAIAMASKEEA